MCTNEENLIQDIWIQWSDCPPLKDYPWKENIDTLLEWLNEKPANMYGFMFDVVISLAYVDATGDLLKSIQPCSNVPHPYNAIIGFTNLCSACYLNANTWKFQKATKPSSGVLGKLSSEVVLKFIEVLNNEFVGSKVIGGTGIIDAALLTRNNNIVLAEIKSAPLLTYPILFNLPESVISLSNDHENITMTRSQLENCDTALFLHTGETIPLGKVGDKNWPFAAMVEFVNNIQSKQIIEHANNLWLKAKEAYISKNKESKVYYLTNACGKPPISAVSDGWPKNESISDSKTSAGLDRTDDIKKGIYQTFKISTKYAQNKNIRTALLSNLPAYRHYDEYIHSFVDLVWGKEKDIINNILHAKDLHRVFDYIITLDKDNSVIRDDL